MTNLTKPPKVSDFQPEQVLAGMRIRGKTREGAIDHIDYHDDRYAWIMWDGEYQVRSGFYDTDCPCEVISGQGEHILADAVSAGVLLFNCDNDKVLGVSRKNNHRDFGLPFGKMEQGETPIAAAIRETLEETGVQLTVELHPIFVRPGSTTGGPAAVFAGWTCVDVPLKSSEEGTVKWIDKEKLLEGSFKEYNSKLLGLVSRSNIFFNGRRCPHCRTSSIVPGEE